MINWDLGEQYRILRAGWDNVVTSPNKIKKATKQYPLDIRYKLAPTTLRREKFGAVVKNGSHINFLSESAYGLLLSFQAPVTPSDVIKQFGRDQNDVLDFIFSCIEEGLIRPEKSVENDARLLFTNITSFPPELEYYRPLGVEVEITNKCYRKCSYCAYESGPNPSIKREDELTPDEWIHVLDILWSEGILALEFTGGDPFVREDALELISYADSLGFSLYINSDLSILGDAHIDALSRLKNLVAIQTSLDGASPETADYTRGRGSFKLALRQMERIRDAKLPLSVGTTVHNKNYAEVGEIAKLVGKYNARYYIGPMYPAGRGYSLIDQVVTEEQWNQATTQFINALQDELVLPADSKWTELVGEVSKYHFSNPARDQVYITHRGNRVLRIDPRGSIYVSAKLRQWHPRFWSLGSIMQKSLSDIWLYSPLLLELRSYSMQSNLFDGIDVRNIRSKPSNSNELVEVTIAS